VTASQNDAAQTDSARIPFENTEDHCVKARNLFQAERVDEIKNRLQQLRPDSVRQWGKMSPAQMLAHCSAGIEMAAGDIRPPRALIGRIIGPAVKRVAVRDDEPMRRNSPTAKELVMTGEMNFESERQRLNGLIDRFVVTGPSGCTDHPHAFFGPLTPDEWAILMYKHLDHHLRQFGT
jgi:Protein of unknown function (DUF1569)